MGVVQRAIVVIALWAAFGECWSAELEGADWGNPRVSGPDQAHGASERQRVTREIEARLTAEQAYLARNHQLKVREKSGQDVAAEKALLKAQRPQFADLEEGAERIVAANPADNAAFEAMGVILRNTSKNTRNAGSWRGSAYDKEHRHLAALLIKYHLGRADFMDTARLLNFSEPSADESFWNKVFEKSAHHAVRGDALVRVARAYLTEVDEFGLPVERQQSIRRAILKCTALIQSDYADLPFAVSWAKGTDEGMQYAPGATLPDLSATTLEGRADSLSRYRGKFVIVDFWATWCPWCVAGQQELIALKEQLRGRPFEIVAVSVDDTVQTVVDYKKTHNLPWVNWHVDPHAAFLSAWGAQGYPTYLFLNPTGVLLGRIHSLTPEHMAYIRQLVSSNLSQRGNHD